MVFHPIKECKGKVDRTRQGGVLHNPPTPSMYRHSQRGTPADNEYSEFPHLQAPHWTPRQADRRITVRLG